MRARTVSRIVILLVAVDALLCLAYLANVALGEPSVKVSMLLDLEAEGNLPTWFSSMQLFVVACVSSVFAAGAFERERRGTWLTWALPLAFLAMSVDEIAQIHEYLGYKSDALLPGGDRANTIFSYTGIWMFVLALPFLALMVGLLLHLRKQFDGDVLRKYILGISLLVVGAAGGDLVANFVTLGSWAHVMEVFAEEFAEMLGATVLLWAALKQARSGTWVLQPPAYRRTEQPGYRLPLQAVRGGRDDR